MDVKLIIALIFYFAVLGIPLISIASVFLYKLYKSHQKKKIAKHRAKFKVLMGGKKHTHFSFKNK